MSSVLKLDKEPTMQVIVLDCNPDIWDLRSKYGAEKLSRFEDVVTSLIVFCNAFLLMHRDNKVCVIANHPAGAVVVYPEEGDGDGMSPPAHALGFLLAERLLELRRQPSGNAAVPSLPQALSTALCIFSERLRESPSEQMRLLVVQLAKDNASTYNAVMNCIFSAQKLEVQVDAMVFGRSDSTFLQQASFITGGVYLRADSTFSQQDSSTTGGVDLWPDDQRGHLQLMMTHLLPSNYMRTVLRTHQPKKIDNKASCFCHGRLVEFAYMCSVCLGLACDESEVCGTCGTPVKKKKTR